MEYRAGRPDGRDVRRRRQAPAPLLAVHRSRPAGPSEPDAWEREMIELLRALLPLARRADRGDRRARRARRRPSCSPPTTASGRPATSSTSTRGSSSRATWPGPTEDERGRRARDTDVGFAEMTRHVHALDWSRTVAYAATPVEPGDPHRRPRPRQRGAAARATCARSSRGEIAAALREVAPPARRAAAGRGGVDARAGVLRALRGSSAPTSRWCWPTAARSRSCPRETIVARRPEPRGHHRWEGIFLAAGPGHPRRRAASRSSRSSTSRRCCCTSSACRCRRTWPARVPEAMFEPRRARAPAACGARRRPPRRRSEPARPRSSSSPRSRPP